MRIKVKDATPYGTLIDVFNVKKFEYITSECSHSREYIEHDTKEDGYYTNDGKYYPVTAHDIHCLLCGEKFDYDYALTLELIDEQ